MSGRNTVAGLERGVEGGVSFLRRSGDRKVLTLVLLHGIGSNAASFAALTTVMPAPLNVIAWDAPGYGASDPLTVERPTPRHYADALAKFLDALGLGRIVLAGHSLGALFAGSFAVHHADRVSALALISPALGYGVTPGGRLPAGVQSRIDEINQIGPAAFAKKRASRLVGDPEALPDIVAAVEQAMAAVRPHGYIQAVHALGAGQLLAEAESIQAPATVAVGALDQITPPANASALYKALPRAQDFHQIANAGHALPQEQPAVLADILARTAETLAHV